MALAEPELKARSAKNPCLMRACATLQIQHAAALLQARVITSVGGACYVITHETHTFVLQPAALQRV